MTTENPLQQAVQLGQHLKTLSENIEAKERELSEIKEQKRHIEQEVLPEFFEQLGVQQITLADGQTIKLNTFPVGRLTTDTRDAALQWLREHNHEGIITNSFKLKLKTHENRLADETRQFLTEHNIPFENKEDIHPSTLKAFIREQVEQEGFPKDLFNVFEVKQVEFSR